MCIQKDATQKQKNNMKFNFKVTLYIKIIIYPCFRKETVKYNYIIV